MSILTDPVDQITFAAIEAFCRADPVPVENVRLDFKREASNKLPQVIAAMANTLGGTILIGIAEKSGRAIWPPKPTGKRGQGESIQQMVNGIYPPVPVDISPVFEFDGGEVLVVRVPESEDAPHAVEQQRRIYERTGEIGRPQELVTLDRLELMMRRRGRLAEAREEQLRRARRRAWRFIDTRKRYGNGPQSAPKRWAAVLPLNPTRLITEPAKCRERIAQYAASLRNETTRQMPSGAYALRSAYPSGRSVPKGFVSLEASGLAFAEEVCGDAAPEGSGGQAKTVSWGRCEVFIGGVVSLAAEFYQQARYDGLCVVAAGFADFDGVQMIPSQRFPLADWGPAFLDDEFSDELMIAAAELKDPAAVSPLLSNLAFGFGVPF